MQGGSVPGYQGSLGSEPVSHMKYRIPGKCTIVFQLTYHSAVGSATVSGKSRFIHHYYGVFRGGFQEILFFRFPGLPYAQTGH